MRLLFLVSVFLTLALGSSSPGNNQIQRPAPVRRAGTSPPHYWIPRQVNASNETTSLLPTGTGIVGTSSLDGTMTTFATSLANSTTSTTTEVFTETSTLTTSTTASTPSPTSTPGRCGTYTFYPCTSSPRGRCMHGAGTDGSVFCFEDNWCNSAWNCNNDSQCLNGYKCLAADNCCRRGKCAKVSTTGCVNTVLPRFLFAEKRQDEGEGGDVGGGGGFGSDSDGDTSAGEEDGDDVGFGQPEKTYGYEYGA